MGYREVSEYVGESQPRRETRKTVFACSRHRSSGCYVNAVKRKPHFFILTLFACIKGQCIYTERESDC